MTLCDGTNTLSHDSEYRNPTVLLLLETKAWASRGTSRVSDKERAGEVRCMHGTLGFRGCNLATSAFTQERPDQRHKFKNSF